MNEDGQVLLNSFRLLFSESDEKDCQAFCI